MSADPVNPPSNGHQGVNMPHLDDLDEQIANMDESINTLLNRANNLIQELNSPVQAQLQRRRHTPNSLSVVPRVDEDADGADNNDSFGSDDTVLYTIGDEQGSNNENSQQQQQQAQPQPEQREQQTDDVEVINLDESVAEVEYIQTFRNPHPILIDLCATADDHSYSSRSRNNLAPIRRRRHAVELSYDRDAVEIIESPEEQRATTPPPPLLVAAAAAATIVAPESPNTSVDGVGKCSICLDNYFRRHPMSTICGHIFCKACITTCIAQNRQCPLCRKKLSLKSIHPLHF